MYRQKAVYIPISSYIPLVEMKITRIHPEVNVNVALADRRIGEINY